MEHSIVPVARQVPAPAGEVSALCPHCQQPLTPAPPRKPKNRHLWVTATILVERTDALALAQQAVVLAERIQPPRLPAYPGGRRGPKRVYADATILLTYLLAKLWRLSYEEMLAWLQHWPTLARALGYPVTANQQVQVITLGTYSKRITALGLWPFWFFFMLLVRHLLVCGLIQGRDVILDSTILRAWSLADPWCAVSYKYRDLNRRFGLKVHTVLDRVSGLPLLLALSPANAHDSPFAVPLLRLVRALYGCSICIVRADAAYDTQATRTYVVQTLHALWAVDYNLRRRGKRWLATISHMRYWRAFMGPRTLIERWFAWVRRHAGLTYFRVQGEAAITRHVVATYCGTLLVAWIALLYHRPDLRHSPSRVLAHFNA